MKVGIEDLLLHDARHDFATKLRRRGVGLDVGQQPLGHADIATTRRYAHVEQQLMCEAVVTQDAPSSVKPKADDDTALSEKRRARSALTVIDGRGRS